MQSFYMVVGTDMAYEVWDGTIRWIHADHLCKMFTQMKCKLPSENCCICLMQSTVHML
jgi:hypothetical protein